MKNAVGCKADAGKGDNHGDELRYAGVRCYGIARILRIVYHRGGTGAYDGKLVSGAFDFMLIALFIRVTVDAVHRVVMAVPVA